MRRFVIAIALLGLLLSACSKGEEIGKGLGCGKTGCLGSIPPTVKPTPPKPKLSKSASAKPSVQTSSFRKGNTWTIKVRDVNNGYEPNSLRAYVGDTVIFQNTDANTAAGHSFTGDNKEWDSGIIKAGKTWTWKVNIKPGLYHWHDENVPYLVGGPLQVLAAS